MAVQRTESVAAILASILLVAAPAATALRSDRNQTISIDAVHQKSTLSRTGKAGDPDVTHFDGKVRISQGSMKIRADHATMYQNPSGVADANGQVGGITRIVFTGKPAHMQQVHDGDCRLMTAQADTINFNNVTGVATLTGNVVVVQKGKGEFHGQNMIYNTNTGDMESGSKSPGGRVHMVVEPRSQKAAATTKGNCGYPDTPAKNLPAASETDSGN